ncbi:hypothetical protein TNCV_1034931 [Trichonephila clavipes]|nr:hypothetical protein TNCV_1034931 [Trichonephila clavipes]
MIVVGIGTCNSKPWTKTTPCSPDFLPCYVETQSSPIDVMQKFRDGSRSGFVRVLNNVSYVLSTFEKAPRTSRSLKTSLNSPHESCLHSLDITIRETFKFQATSA